MATTNYSIFFDDECPFCIWYSAKFVKWGIIGEENRKPFQHIYNRQYDQVDRELARNQIALVDENTKEIFYGADSMIKLLAQKQPIFNIFLQYKPLHFIARHFYQLISYNRKVFAPNLACSTSGCQPDFHIGYRSAFLLLTALFTGLILNQYTKPIYLLQFGHDMPKAWEWFVCFGQLIFQGTIISLIDRKQIWNYLGQMSLISFVGALALVPMLLVQQTVGLSHYVTIGYFGTIVFGMFLWHSQRVAIIGAPKVMTITWILYRLIILGIMTKI